MSMKRSGSAVSFWFRAWMPPMIETSAPDARPLPSASASDAAAPTTSETSATATTVLLMLFIARLLSSCPSGPMPGRARDPRAGDDAADLHPPLLHVAAADQLKGRASGIRWAVGARDG